VPGSEYPVWDQFRDAGGKPIYPQRPMLLGPMFTQATSGTLPSGAIGGKMIVLSSLLDREAFPWQADWYRSRVAEHLGADADARFRLWYIDNALHGDDEQQEFPTRTVTYLGALETALRQLAAWVERGIEPSPTSNYRVEDGQIVLPATAAERRGVQPVVTLAVDGSARATVRAGEPLTMTVRAEATQGTIIELQADLAGSGTLDTTLDIAPAPRVVVECRLVFEAPGTYYPAVRVAAQSEGDSTAAHARVHNIARVRVDVTA
jgi:hypothetical protein